jgi:hypothetical protein
LNALTKSPGRLLAGLPAALGVVALLAGAPAARAQAAGDGGIGGPGAIDLPGFDGGGRLTSIDIETSGTTGDREQDARIRQSALDAFGFSPGESFNDMLARQGLARVRTLGGVGEASFRLVRSINPDGRTLVLQVTLAKSPAAQVRTPGFPILFQDDRSLVRLMLNGGAGAFHDVQPWFGQPASFTRRNPLVETPAVGAGTGARATWAETYVEYGIGGITQLGSSDLYVYGAATAITPLSVGRDIFRDDARATVNFEKLYAGLLYARRDGGPRVNISTGRQNFTLNDGFLVAQYGSQSNAGPRPGIYLAPRTTHDFAQLVTVKWDRWVSTSFFLDPNEYEPIESKTQLFGTNLRYSFSKGFFADASVMHVPQSRRLYRAPLGGVIGREGLTTFAGHLRWADADLLPGVWLEGEYAHQTNANFPMSAHAAYGTVGYLARHLPWTPSLSWRYAFFTGDDPATRRYERFDSLFSGGLNEWLQGITINKVLTQENRATHRLRFNVSPREGLNFTLDYFRHRADELNNLGGSAALSQLQSKDLGQELQFATRWAVSRNLYFVGVASHAIPGDAIKAAAPGAKPWSSLQVQLYWNF